MMADFGLWEIAELFPACLRSKVVRLIFYESSVWG